MRGDAVIRPIRRKRVLVVNAYLDHLRRIGPRKGSIPQTMAPAFLAGAFARERCEVRAYNEHHSGPLTDASLLGWPDMLVLTGLTCAFDRLLHLTAYARTKNPKVIVVAGGQAVRALPDYSRRFFDYACLGGVEEMTEVIQDAFGPGYAASEVFPRYDLARWVGRAGYVESSRHCNFRCSFCSLTADGYRYQPYPVDFTRRQILAQGKRRFIIFLDNNFYGNDPEFFHARLEMLRELFDDGRILGWGALVTNNFFEQEQNLVGAHRAGCRALFSGVESFDLEALRRFRKHQNTRVPQVEMIRRCLHAGIAFLYGIVLDFSTRTLAEIHREMEFIVGNSEIPLPNYFTPVIPLLGTPCFHECVREDRLLAHAKLRDFTTTTLVSRPLDPIEEVTAFLRDLPTLRRYRRRLPRHVLGLIRRYRRSVSMDSMRIMLGSALMSFAPNLSSGLNFRRNPRGRTHLTTTEPLDPLYTPAFPIDSRYEAHFRPTMITDAGGALNEELLADLLPTRSVPMPRRPTGSD